MLLSSPLKPSWNKHENLFWFSTSCFHFYFLRQTHQPYPETSYRENDFTNLLGFWFLRGGILFRLCRVSSFHLFQDKTFPVFHFRQNSAIPVPAIVKHDWWRLEVKLPETKRRRDSRVLILLHPNQRYRAVTNNKSIHPFEKIKMNTHTALSQHPQGEGGWQAHRSTPVQGDFRVSF